MELNPPFMTVSGGKPGAMCQEKQRMVIERTWYNVTESTHRLMDHQ
jgi:hypothetical protein